MPSQSPYDPAIETLEAQWEEMQPGRYQTLTESDEDAAWMRGFSHAIDMLKNKKAAENDWSAWIAVLPRGQYNQRWCIAPKVFWEERHYIPDECLDRVPAGFFECQEHTLDSSSSLPEQEKMLLALGFEIVQWPK